MDRRGPRAPQAFLRIVLPLSTPGMVATAILCFIFSWNNFQLALVLGGFDVSTAPVSVFKYADPEAGGSGPDDGRGDPRQPCPSSFIVLLIQKQFDGRPHHRRGSSSSPRLRRPEDAEPVSRLSATPRGEEGSAGLPTVAARPPHSGDDGPEAPAPRHSRTRVSRAWAFT